MQWSQKVSIETLQKFHSSFHSIFRKKRVTFFMTSFKVKKGHATFMESKSNDRSQFCSFNR